MSLSNGILSSTVLDKLSTSNFSILQSIFRCHLLNSANFNTIQEYVDAVKPNIMEHRLCLLERDCDSSSVPYPVLDKAVKDLIGASSKNSLIIFMLESPEKSILYAKSKNY